MAVTTYNSATLPSVAPQRGGSRSAKVASVELINRTTAAGYVMTMRDVGPIMGGGRIPQMASRTSIARSTAARTGFGNRTTVSGLGTDNLFIRGLRTALMPIFWHRGQYVTILSFFRSYVVQPPGTWPVDPGTGQAVEPRKWPQDYIKRLFPRYSSRWNQ